MIERTGKLETACRDFEEDLVLFYYGDGLEAERSRVEGHIKACSSCSRFLDDLHKLLPQMAEPKELPRSFWDNYHREVVQKLAAQQARSSWWKDFFAATRAWAVPAFGTAVVAVLAVALVVGKTSWNLQSSRSQGSIPQEIMADTNQLEFFNSMDMLESLRALESLDASKTNARIS
jgi:hypothetical protein